MTTRSTRRSAAEPLRRNPRSKSGPNHGSAGTAVPVDPWFIVATAPDESTLIRTAREVNEGLPYVLDKLLPQARRIQDVRIAALGLAFKPNIDDLRESPARQIVGQLADELPAANIMAVEPNIDRLPSELEERDNVTLTGVDEAVHAADIVLLLVDHTEFTRLDRTLLTQKIVHDTRGVWG